MWIEYQVEKMVQVPNTGLLRNHYFHKHVIGSLFLLILSNQKKIVKWEFVSSYLACIWQKKNHQMQAGKHSTFQRCNILLCRNSSKLTVLFATSYASILVSMRSAHSALERLFLVTAIKCRGEKGSLGSVLMHIHNYWNLPNVSCDFDLLWCPSY